MAKPVIVSAARPPIGTLGGALAQQPATKLGASPSARRCSAREARARRRSTRSSSATCCRRGSA